jgi:hypothetical protein
MKQKLNHWISLSCVFFLSMLSIIVIFNFSLDAQDYGQNLAYTTTAKSLSHLDWAELLVKDIQPQNNQYGSRPSYIRWKGIDGAKVAQNRTVCSSFITRLLQKTYGYKLSYFDNWLGSRTPNAAQYYDAIASQNRFQKIPLVSNIQPGDLVAIKYLKLSHSEDEENRSSGHIMLVEDFPKIHPSSNPKIDETQQYELIVIDSSKSGHGKYDTRRQPDGSWGKGGVGKGIMRLYTDKSGRIAGYTWSTFSNSQYYSQSQNHLVIGRLKS